MAHYFNRTVIYVPIVIFFDKTDKFNKNAVAGTGYYDLTSYFAGSSENGWEAPAICSSSPIGTESSISCEPAEPENYHPNSFTVSSTSIEEGTTKFRVIMNAKRIKDSKAVNWGHCSAWYSRYFAIEVSTIQGVYYNDGTDLAKYISSLNPKDSRYYANNYYYMNFANPKAVEDLWVQDKTYTKFRKEDSNANFIDLSTCPLAHLDMSATKPRALRSFGGYNRYVGETYQNIFGTMFINSNGDLQFQGTDEQNKNFDYIIEKKYFNGLTPSRVLVYCQGSGGGGGGTVWFSSGSGGGGGGTSVFCLRLPNPTPESDGKWYFTVGAGGAHGYQGDGGSGNSTGFFTLDPRIISNTTKPDYHFYGSYGGGGGGSNGAGGGSGGSYSPSSSAGETVDSPAWFLQGRTGQAGGGPGSTGSTQEAITWYVTRNQTLKNQTFYSFFTKEHKGGACPGGSGGGGGASCSGNGGEGGHDTGGLHNGRKGGVGSTGAGGGGGEWTFAEFIEGGDGGPGLLLITF